MKNQSPNQSPLLTVNTMIARCLLTVMLILLAGSAYSQSDSDTKFVIGPAPIAKTLLPGEKTNRAEFLFTNVSITPESNGAEDLELDFIGFSWSQRSRSDNNWRRGLRKTVYGSYGQTNTDSTTFDMEFLNMTIVTDGELYINKTGSFLLFGGIQLGIGNVSNTVCLQTCNDSDASIYSYGLRAGLQKRFPLGLNFGITPYALVSAIGQEIIPDDGTESTSNSLVNSVVGLDFDFRNISLTAFIQNSDGAEVTSLSLGFNF